MHIHVNCSDLDRMVRAVVGMIIFYFGIAGIVQGVVGIILLVWGILLMVSAATGYEPIYDLLHIHTNRLPE